MFFAIDTAIAKIQDEYKISPDDDLNKVSPDELARKKSFMEESFFRNLIKPGDPEYEFDKRVEFKKDENLSENTWDDITDNAGELFMNLVARHASTNLLSTRTEALKNAPAFFISACLMHILPPARLNKVSQRAWLI